MNKGGAMQNRLGLLCLQHNTICFAAFIAKMRLFMTLSTFTF